MGCCSSAPRDCPRRRFNRSALPIVTGDASLMNHIIICERGVLSASASIPERLELQSRSSITYGIETAAARREKNREAFEAAAARCNVRVQGQARSPPLSLCPKSPLQPRSEMHTETAAEGEGCRRKGTTRSSLFSNDSLYLDLTNSSYNERSRVREVRAEPILELHTSPNNSATTKPPVSVVDDVHV